MTKSETAWAAGILEGEGCFDYNRVPKYPRIRIEMVDVDVVQRLQSMLGGKITRPKRRRSQHQQTVLLNVNGEAARKAMRAIRPWLGQRRRAKVDALLQAS